MAQTEEEKLQASLFAELEKSDVKVADDKAAEMKENILKANSGQAWLGLGIHDVFIKSVELTQAKSGTLGMKLVVENEEGKNDVTMWLSEAALPYTIENVSRLVVHNTAEDKKADARSFMSNIVSAKELLTVAKAKLVDGVAFLSVREAKDGSTYLDKNGVEQVSLERNLLSYKPKETTQQAVAKVVGGGKTASPEEKLEIPF
jgi:hypothetical protein